MCTVTIPDGVVANKRIQWKQRRGSFGLTDIMDNDGSIQIVYSDLDQPVSSSVLTVQENSAGQYHYYCQVNIDELDGIEMKEDVHPIDVIGTLYHYLYSVYSAWSLLWQLYTGHYLQLHYHTFVDLKGKEVASFPGFPLAFHSLVPRLPPCFP